MSLDATIAGLAWDTHTHVFGPHDRYPLAVERAYTPPVRWIDALSAVAGVAGIGHVVMVHPSVYGLDLSSLTDALAAGGGRYRAVAAVPPDVSRDRLQELHGLGVRGLRFNRVLVGGQGFDGFDRVAALAMDLGWHAQILIEPQDLPQVMRLRERTTLPLVVDHLAGFDASTDADGAAWRSFVGFVRERECYVKLSGGYRLSRRGYPYDDLNPLVRSLLAAAPDRLLWGSDWPHTWFFGRPGAAAPAYDDLLATFVRSIADPALVRRILVENPERLYR